MPRIYVEAGGVNESKVTRPKREAMNREMMKGMRLQVRVQQQGQSTCQQRCPQTTTLEVMTCLSLELVSLHTSRPGHCLRCNLKRFSHIELKDSCTRKNLVLFLPSVQHVPEAWVVCRPSLTTTRFVMVVKETCYRHKLTEAPCEGLWLHPHEALQSSLCWSELW